MTDILSELEKQVGPLAKQSEAAKEYLRLKEDLKKYDVNQFLLETAGTRSQLKRSHRIEGSGRNETGFRTYPCGI